MGTKAQHYLERARYCEDMAAMTGGHRVSADFAELARQWRELACQRQDFEKSLPDSDWSCRQAASVCRNGTTPLEMAFSALRLR
jgi:hypothetical protein